MLFDLGVTVVGLIGACFGTLWLMLVLFGDGDARSVIPGVDEGYVPEADDPDFIAMPRHLATRDEMVAWMTRDLPSLMASADLPVAGRTEDRRR